MQGDFIGDPVRAVEGNARRQGKLPANSGLRRQAPVKMFE